MGYWFEVHMDWEEPKPRQLKRFGRSLSDIFMDANILKQDASCDYSFSRYGMRRCIKNPPHVYARVNEVATYNGYADFDHHDPNSFVIQEIKQDVISAAAKFGIKLTSVYVRTLYVDSTWTESSEWSPPNSCTLPGYSRSKCIRRWKKHSQARVLWRIKKAGHHCWWLKEHPDNIFRSIKKIK